MTIFDMNTWGSEPRTPGSSWSNYLWAGALRLNQDEDTLLQAFPSAPELSHLTVKLQGQGEGKWLACFHVPTVERAWKGGMPTFLVPTDHEFVHDRTLRAREFLLAGDTVHERFQVVRYPAQEGER